MIRGRVRGPNNLPSMKRCGFTTWVESKHWMAAAIVLCWRCTAQRRRFVRACHNGFHLRNRKGGNPETSEVSWSPPKTFEKKNSSFQRKGCKTTVPYVCVCNFYLEVMCIWLMICPKETERTTRSWMWWRRMMQGTHLWRGALSMLQKVWSTSWNW